MVKRSDFTREAEKFLNHYIKYDKYEEFTECFFCNWKFIEAEINDLELLHSCSKYNSCVIMLFLLRQDLDINRYNSKQKTPLHIAIKYKSIEAIEILIEKGALLTKPDSKGRTSLDLGVDKLVDISELFGIKDEAGDEYLKKIFENLSEEEDDFRFHYEYYEEDEPAPHIAVKPKENKLENKRIKLNDELFQIRKKNEFIWFEFIKNPAYSQIPYPVGPESNILGLEKSMNPRELKDLIRISQKRWHPDKFTQRFSKFLSDEKYLITIRKVNEIIQKINKLSEEYL